MNLSRCPILLLLLFALFCSCHDEDREDIPPTDERTANFIVKYNDGSGIHPDYNAKVYIYYGIYSMDIAGFRYLPDGVLEYRGQEIVPDIELSADGKEDVSLLLNNTEKVTVVVESSFYEGKIGSPSFNILFIISLFSPFATVFYQKSKFLISRLLRCKITFQVYCDSGADAKSLQAHVCLS